MKKCPRCGLKSDGRFCPDCGFDLVSELESMGNEEVMAEENTDTESQLEELCENDAITSDNTTGNNKRKSKKKIVIGIVLVIAIVIVALFGNSFLTPRKYVNAVNLVKNDLYDSESMILIGNPLVLSATADDGSIIETALITFKSKNKFGGYGSSDSTSVIIPDDGEAFRVDSEDLELKVLLAWANVKDEKESLEEAGLAVKELDGKALARACGVKYSE